MPSLLSNLKSAREWAMPTLKSSAFLSRGVLTPEEFVAAGDELVFKCPTWTWESGDPSKRKAFLPADKQFLMTRNVPCGMRANSLENVVAVSNHDAAAGGGLDDDDGDWLVSQVLTAEELRKREEKALEDEFHILDDDGELMASGGDGGDVEKKVARLSINDTNQKTDADAAAPTTSADNDAGAGEDEDGEYADMADFEDDNVMEDEAAVTATTPASSADKNTNDNIVKVRSYDISITYDKYYQTPRVWLMGYTDDGSNTPLTGDEMMQDVISDYAHRTVTVENHPHVSGPHASIHPCQHGAVMKTIVKNLTRENSEEGEEGKSSSNGPTVEMYLFIFLKFVSSMIPTINYDFTMDVSASTKK